MRPKLKFAFGASQTPRRAMEIFGAYKDVECPRAFTRAYGTEPIKEAMEMYKAKLGTIKFSRELNQILTETGRDIIINAAAGTGKTTAIVLYALARIADHTIAPHDIFICSYTNAAACNICDRFSEYGIFISPKQYNIFGMICVSTADSLAALLTQRRTQSGQYDFSLAIRQASDALASGRAGAGDSPLLVIVDEAQDVDVDRWNMLVRYAGKRARFVAIGDIRQRLYISDSPFQRAIVRGAIMEGRGGAASIQMNYCHRCPPNVLAAANCVSLMTYGRLHSEVTGRENGETQSIRAIAFATMEDELEYICSQIKSGRAGRSAVLFPSASRERAGELPCAYGALRAHGLSYNYDYKVFDASKDVTVTTIHSSKGSEWDHVYVAGMQSTRFPFSSATNEIARNTFYVALTRARVSCEFLSWHERVHSRMTMLVEEIPGLFNLEYKYQPARAPAVSAPDFNFRPIPVTKLVEEHETAEIGNGDVRVEKLPPIQLRHACEEIPPGDMRLIYGMFADIAIKRELVPGYMPPVYHAYRLNEVRRLTTDELRSLVNKGALIHAEGSAYVDVAAGNVVFCTMSDGFNDVSQATNELLCGDPKNVAVLWEIAKLDFYINRKYGYMQHIAVDVERCEKILENCSVIAAQLKGEYTTFKCDPVVRGESLCGICDVAARRDETTTILEFKYSIDDNNFFAITGNSMQCALYRRLAHVPAAVAINIATGSRQIITGDTFFSRVTDYISARFIVASVNRFNQLKCVRESPIPTYIAAGCAAPRILSIGDPFRRKKCTSFSEVVEFCDPFKSAKLAIYMSLPVFRAWRESGFPFPPGWEFRPVLAPEMPLLAEHPTPTDADLMWCYRCLGLTPQTS